MTATWTLLLRNARIESINPVRYTLEDFFIEKLNLQSRNESMELARK